MAKPLSRPNEIGRAIGYRVDVRALLEALEERSIDSWDRLKKDRAFLEHVQRAAQSHLATGRGKRPKRLWVVMKMERAVPVMIDAYVDRRSANRREQFLRQHMRPETDQVEVFQVKLQT